MKILIIEDDAVSQKVLEKFLEQFGKCTITGDGRHGIKEFDAATRAGIPYNLVCIDISLPNLNGQEVLEELRRHETALGLSNEQRTKIFITTSSKDPYNVVKAFRAGCEAYITKPINRELLLDEIAKLELEW